MKKLITFFSFFILTSTVFANSVGGSIGGWQVVSNVASGVGAKISATKEVMINGASKVVTGTANITPNPTNVAKFMAKAAGAAVVTTALDYLLDGVDYVMNPVNNTLTYKPKSTSCSSYTDCAYAPKLYSATINGKFHGYYSSNSEYCSTLRSKFSTYYPGYGFDGVSSGTNACSGRMYPLSNPSSWQLTGYASKVIDNPSYNPAAPDKTQPKTVPISDVGTQVIDQADKDIKAGNPSSPAVALSRAVAQDMIQTAEAEQDNVKPNPIVAELDKTTTYPTTEDATGTVDTPAVVDPITGEIVKPAETSNVDIKIPKACEWFPQICVFIDWMQKEPELDEDPELPTKEIDKKEIKDNLVTISSSSCPAPYPVSIELPVLKTVYTDSIDISPYCSEIEKLAPVLQLLAFVLAVFIIKDI